MKSFTFPALSRGVWNSRINVPHPIGAAEALPDAAYAQGYDVHQTETDEALLAQAVELARTAQAAVIFAGQPDSFETEGADRETMDLPANQNALIQAVAAVQPNTVVILHGGAPMVLPWLDKVKAVLMMYLAGERSGEAAVKLLYGETNPSGKLAKTWPLRIEDNPSYLNFPGWEGAVEYREGIYIGYRYYDKKKMPVQFPFGHGLSYTSFAYSDIHLDKAQMADTDTLTVRCKVKNTGHCAGAEAVQLYIRDVCSTAPRPVRELKGFEKVFLLPGEEKEISFILDKRSFAYYDPKLHDWFVETGEFAVEIGSSSRNILLTAAVTVNGTAELPIRYTHESTVGDLLKTAKGRAVMQKLMSGKEEAVSAAEVDNLKNMGEGSDRMVQAMMMEMPLGSIVTFGRMTREQLDGLLAMLNNG